ncbi:MAG TPA: metallophosphoesterase family protein [Vicinamibacterales bacterium]|nr:metallophosphoesterase family protein [Vicinamibacterales bacterium]
MPEFHAEPYLHLAGVSSSSALIAWGAFYFRVRSKGEWKLVDDRDLNRVHPPRRDSIGVGSTPYGIGRVDVFDESGALAATARSETTNWCYITGLKPDTRYRYQVTVNDEVWAEGERYDWHPGAEQGLVKGAGRYVNQFRTHPSVDMRLTEPVSFAIIGDFGVGIRKTSPTKRQREIGEALTRAAEQFDLRFVLTTGDNVYAGKRLLGFAIGDHGDEDDDWFFTFYQPYRYLLNRIPVYPSIGNHDSAETEDRDDREQVLDNFFLRERMASDEATGKASLDPGLFYRVHVGHDIELICLDTSKEHFFSRGRLFQHPEHQAFLEESLQIAEDNNVLWRIPFCHHPPYSAGPRHHNTTDMHPLMARLRASRVRVMFNGHEHNFQHSHADGIDYFVTGAAGKLRRGRPNQFAEAHTVSWADTPHFLLVTIDGKRMTVRAIGELLNGELSDIPRRGPDDEFLAGPMIVDL